MVDLNRIASYLTISLIVILGIAIVGGLLGDFEWEYRVGIGIIIGIYVVVRLWLASMKPRPRSMIRYKDDVKDD